MSVKGGTPEFFFQQLQALAEDAANEMAAIRREALEKAKQLDAKKPTRTRPMRTAVSVALTNIRKQSQMPLNRKIRRPAESEINTDALSSSKPVRTVFKESFEKTSSKELDISSGQAHLPKITQTNEISPIRKSNIVSAETIVSDKLSPRIPRSLNINDGEANPSNDIDGFRVPDSRLGNLDHSSSRKGSLRKSSTIWEAENMDASVGGDPEPRRTRSKSRSIIADQDLLQSTQILNGTKIRNSEFCVSPVRKSSKSSIGKESLDVFTFNTTKNTSIGINRKISTVQLLELEENLPSNSTYNLNSTNSNPPVETSKVTRQGRTRTKRNKSPPTGKGRIDDSTLIELDDTLTTDKSVGSGTLGHGEILHINRTFNVLPSNTDTNESIRQGRTRTKRKAAQSSTKVLPEEVISDETETSGVVRLGRTRTKRKANKTNSMLREEDFGDISAKIFCEDPIESALKVLEDAPVMINKKKIGKRSRISAADDSGKRDVRSATLKVTRASSKNSISLCDIDGNPLPSPIGTRTKTLTGPTVMCIPSPNTTIGRPMRKRTKAKRFGVDSSDENDDEQPVRVYRARTKKMKQDTKENQELFKAKRKSGNQAKRMSTYLANVKRFKTPLSAVTNNMIRPRILLTAGKETGSTVKKRPAEPRIFIKAIDNEDVGKKENRMKLKQLREEKAATKKEDEIRKKTLWLKQKNDEKLKRVLRCKEIMEAEKYEQVVQTEKKKEMKRQMIMREREMKQKAEITKKKMMTEKKMAELEERRRIEEEARLAKIREMELEQQRIQQEKQQQLELEEKIARELQEEKKRIAQAVKNVKLTKKVEAPKTKANQLICSYQPRNENDLGLLDEHSILNSDDEREGEESSVEPAWVKAIKGGNPEKKYQKYLTKQRLAQFIPIRAKTPDLRPMFNMTPTRVLRRTSSAIWNTPDFTP